MQGRVREGGDHLAAIMNESKGYTSAVAIMSVRKANMYWDKIVISSYGSVCGFPNVPVVAHGSPSPAAMAFAFFANLQSRGFRSAISETENSLDML